MPYLRIKEPYMSHHKLATITGTSQFTINRELKRNTGRRGYRFIDKCIS